MGFAELIGHSQQLQSLRAALASGRLHHAYLFAGPEGVGKRTIALALAKAVHCAERAGDYCGRCVDCASIGDDNHADVRYVSLLPDKKEISIHQVRALERDLRFRSFGGKRKIAIVDPAASMNAAAQNALLKTLEEPPENSLVVLITPNASALLPTLRSRCLRLAFAPLARAQVAGFLQAGRKIAARDAEVLAATSMGSIGVAASLDQQALFEKRRIWADLLNELKTRDYRGAMAAAETLAGSREETLEFLAWAESWYRDVLVHGTTGEAGELVNPDMLPQMEQGAARFAVKAALNALGHISEATAGVHRNLNRRMVLEKFLFGVVEGR
jgi:DNA polymerase-3 subunit delta'